METHDGGQEKGESDILSVLENCVTRAKRRRNENIDTACKLVCSVCGRRRYEENGV